MSSTLEPAKTNASQTKATCTGLGQSMLMNKAYTHKEMFEGIYQKTGNKILYRRF